MDDKVVDVEGFDPAGMTREELIETVVRLPHARSASVTLRKRTSSSARNFRGSARRRVVGDNPVGGLRMTRTFDTVDTGRRTS